jgi:hypothetical protein
LDDHFEEDFENFSEDTGIEDIGIDSQTFRQVNKKQKYSPIA